MKVSLLTKSGSNLFWSKMPENCVRVSRQFKGDWIGNYDNSIVIVCYDFYGKIIKIIEQKDLPFDVNWNEIKRDNFNRIYFERS